uniref:Uncharacterized protein n=1 Tax=viral metagenome TaxID=1070528 RepID=A0A6C0DGL0_9ZZZZ
MSTQTPGTTATATATAITTPAATPTEPVPNPTCLVQAARLAIQQDKPIQLDYFSATANKTAFIGEDGETKEKVLIKSKDEFTSHIQKLYKVGEDYIIITENSIYIVSGAIQKRKLNLAALQAAE